MTPGIEPTAGTRPAAAPDDVITFFTQFGHEAADSVMRTGPNYVVQVGTHPLVIEAAQLEQQIRSELLDRDSILLRSLLVYEAALDAQLRQSTARSVLLAYRTLVLEGQDAAMAMQMTFVNVALACEVEAYVNSQKGLTTDIRHVSEYSLHARETGVDEERADSLQAELDDRLHAYTDAVAEARESGDYSTAYDAQQAFFQCTAAITDTPFWQERAQARGQDLALMQHMAGLARARREPGRDGLLAACGLSLR